MVSLTKLINLEKTHCNLFDLSKTKIKFVENYEESLINKLKITEELKANIPVNIKNVFATYLLLQNIYWYRLLNKTFYKDDNEDKNYRLMFGITYTDNKLDNDNNWKDITKGLILEINTISKNLIKKRISKNRKINNIIEKKSQPNSITNTNETVIDTAEIVIETKTETETARKQSSTEITDQKIQLLAELSRLLHETELPIMMDSPDLNYDLNENESTLTRDKSSHYFRELFIKAEQSIKYTYLWKMINENFSKKYYIHLRMHEIYNDVINQEIIKSDNKHKILNTQPIIDQDKLQNLKNTISNLVKYMKPISIFIDARLYNNTLTENPLLLFQVRTIVHIITSFIGSHMYLFFEKLIYNEIISRHIETDSVDAYELTKELLDDLKKYICNDYLENGNLSYDFIRLFMGFSLDGDAEEDISIDEIFEKIISKILNNQIKTKFTGLDENSKIIENIKINIIPYYIAIYKEVTQQLLNFSDSYYRYIKNQYTSIMMFNILIKSN